MKKYLTIVFLFVVAVVAVVLADYPAGNNNCISHSIVGWDNGTKCWRPVAVSASGSLELPATSFTERSLAVATEAVSIGSTLATPNRMFIELKSKTNTDFYVSLTGVATYTSRVCNGYFYITLPKNIAVSVISASAQTINVIEGGY